MEGPTHAEEQIGHAADDYLARSAVKVRRFALSYQP